MSTGYPDIPLPPLDHPYPYAFQRWIEQRAGEGPYFVMDFALWGTWRVSWWLGLN